MDGQVPPAALATLLSQACGMFALQFARRRVLTPHHFAITMQRRLRTVTSIRVLSRTSLADAILFGRHCTIDTGHRHYSLTLSSSLGLVIIPW